MQVWVGCLFAKSSFWDALIFLPRWRWVRFHTVIKISNFIFSSQLLLFESKAYIRFLILVRLQDRILYIFYFKITFDYQNIFTIYMTLILDHLKVILQVYCTSNERVIFINIFRNNHNIHTHIYSLFHFLYRFTISTSRKINGK